MPSPFSQRLKNRRVIITAMTHWTDIDIVWYKTSPSLVINDAIRTQAAEWDHRPRQCNQTPYRRRASININVAAQGWSGWGETPTHFFSPGPQIRLKRRFAVSSIVAKCLNKALFKTFYSRPVNLFSVAVSTLNCPCMHLTIAFVQKIITDMYNKCHCIIIMSLHFCLITFFEVIFCLITSLKQSAKIANI